MADAAVKQLLLNEQNRWRQENNTVSQTIKHEIAGLHSEARLKDITNLNSKKAKAAAWFLETTVSMLAKTLPEAGGKKIKYRLQYYYVSFL